MDAALKAKFNELKESIMNSAPNGQEYPLWTSYPAKNGFLLMKETNGRSIISKRTGKKHWQVSMKTGQESRFFGITEAQFLKVKF